MLEDSCESRRVAGGEDTHDNTASRVFFLCVIIHFDVKVHAILHTLWYRGLGVGVGALLRAVGAK